MSSADEPDDEDVPALPRPRSHYLRSEECPEPEDAVENGSDRRLIEARRTLDEAESMRLMSRKESVSRRGVEFIESTVFVEDLTETR